MRRRNLIGRQIQKLRLQKHWSQEILTAKLQIEGLDISRSSVSKIESGEQTVFDFQILYFRRVLRAENDDLFAGFDPRARDLHQKVTKSMGA